MFEAVSKVIPTLKFETEIYPEKVVKLQNPGVIYQSNYEEIFDRNQTANPAVLIRI